MRRVYTTSFANQSFALVAVLILLMAAASVTIIYAMSREEMERASRTRAAIILDDMANGHHVTVANTAEGLAWVAIYYAAEVRRDTSNLSVEFRASFDSYIENNYPHMSGRYTVNVTDHNVSLVLKTYDYYDVLPPAAAYDNKAKSDQYKPANIHLGGEVKQTNGFVCYQLTGYVNYSVNDTLREGGLTKSIRIEQVLKDKHPFLDDKFTSFRSDGSVDSQGIGRIVKYILTTIAQFRAAQGWAWRDGKVMGAFADLAGADGVVDELEALSNMSATSLLTPTDVELAANLAVILVEVKSFRTFDPDAMAALDAKFPGIEAVVKDWLYNDRIDPADIIVLYHGYGSKASGQPLNLKLIMAQALFSIVDQLLFKYFDLLGLGPFVAEFFETVGNLTKMIADIIDEGADFIDKIWDGKDFVEDELDKYLKKIPSFGTRADAGVSAKNRESTRLYIQKTINNLGIGTTVFNVPLTGWPKEDIDVNKTFTTKVLVQGKPVYKNVTCNYTIDADGNLTNGYETNVSKNLTYLKHYESKVYTIDVRIRQVEAEVRFKPVDITAASAAKDHIWEEFYNRYLKVEKKEGFELVKDKLGNFFSTCYDTVMLLRELMDDISDRLLSGNLTDAYKFVEDVNPADRTPFLRQMERQVFGAVDNIVDYYTYGEGGEKIRDVLTEVLGDGGLEAQNRLIEGIRTTIKDHFDELVGTDNTYRYTFNTDPQVASGTDLAQRLTAPAYLEFYLNMSCENRTTNNAWVQPREHEMWQVYQQWNWFDIWAETPTEQQLRDAAQARISKPSWCDYNWLSPSHLEDVFYALRPFVDDAYAQVKDYELNASGGIRWKLNLTKLDPKNPGNYFKEYSGVKTVGLMMLQMMAGSSMGGTGEGIIDTFGIWVKFTVGKILTGAEFANTPYYIATMASGQFEFFSGNLTECRRTGNVEADGMVLSQEPKYLPVALRPLPEEMSQEYYRFLNDMDYGSERRLFVDFFNPRVSPENSTYGYNASDILGMRYNSPDRFSIPYQADWNIRMFGTVDLNAFMGTEAMLVNGRQMPTTHNDTLVINITVRVSILTGWALRDVDYERETTAIEYIQDVIDRVWQYLVQMVKPAIDSVMNVIDTISNFASKIMGYAQQAMEFINNAEQYLITTLQTFIGNVLDKIVQWLMGYKEQIEAFLSAIRFSLYGVDFTISINTDYLQGKYNRTKPTPIFDVYIKAGSDIDLTMRVTTVPKSKYGYDVTLTGPFRIEGIEFSLVVDPFMCFYNHMFSLYGKKVDQNGNGWGLEIQIPELVVYKKLEASVVIGTPAGIPIPIISVSVFPTIGVNLKYGFPRMTDIIINEFSFYRMELYNPTPKAIDVNGWKVVNRNDPTRSFNITKEVPIWIGQDVKDEYRRERLRDYNRTLLQPGEENENSTQTEGFVVPRDPAGYKMNRSDSELANKTHYLYIPPLSYATIHFIEAYPRPYWQQDESNATQENESGGDAGGEDGGEEDESGGGEGEGEAGDSESEGDGEDDEGEGAGGKGLDLNLSGLNPAELKERLQVPSASTVITDLIGGDISFLGTGKGMASAGEGIRLLNAEGEQVDQTVIKRYKGTEWNPDPRLHPNNTIEGDRPNPKDWFIKPSEDEGGSTRGIYMQSAGITGKPMSWQRKYDAGYEWLLKEENFGLRNNYEVPKLDIKVAVLTALYEAFAESFIENRIQQKIEGANITLDDVVNCIRGAIDKFIEKILELIRRVVIELEFFIDMGVAPTGTPKPVGGIRISFVMDGEGLALLLEWLVKVIGFMVNKLLFNDKSGGFPPLPGELPEHMFFRFATYVSMDSLPESIKAKLPPDATAAGMSINFMVQANLPVIGALLGEDWGDWRIDFGIYLTGPTKPLVQALYQTKTMDNPDFYLIKGQVFQIRGGGK